MHGQTFSFCDDCKNQLLTHPKGMPATKPDSRNSIEHLLPDALAVYTMILQSEDASLDMKFKAAKAIIDISSANNKKSAPDQDTPYSIVTSMSLDELIALRAEVQGILLRRAKNLAIS
ncbi:MAG: hypothetical protein AB1454_02945 [Candidatus Auribacterota bacterium]